MKDEDSKKEQFHSLVLNIPGAVYRCACDENWTMQYISDFIEVISGYPSSDFIDNRVRTFNSIIHPEDSQSAGQTVLAALEQKESYEIEYRIIHADGTIRWLYEKGRGVFRDNGEVLWLDGAIFDITDRKNAEEKREKILKELQEALAEVKTLSGLLPICASCKKIRDDKGYWNQIEGYIKKHSEAEFTHGMCPECEKKLWGDQEWYKKRKNENT